MFKPYFKHSSLVQFSSVQSLDRLGRGGGGGGGGGGGMRDGSAEIFLQSFLPGFLHWFKT